MDEKLSGQVDRIAQIQSIELSMEWLVKLGVIDNWFRTGFLLVWPNETGVM